MNLLFFSITLCDPGWQSQPRQITTYTLNTYRNWETNTYKILALLQHNSITEEYTTYPLFVAILPLTLLIYHALIQMAWQGGGPLFIGQGGSQGGEMCPPSRDFLNITRFYNLFITNSRVLHENIFLLPCGEYSRRLPCILPTFNTFNNYQRILQTIWDG